MRVHPGHHSRGGAHGPLSSIFPPPPDAHCRSAAAPPAPPPPLREKDDSIREAMAEALLAFASTRLGRAALWKIKAPDILKKGCEWRYSVHAAFVRPLA